MKANRGRRLAFELLESKASPSALLLALAPLDEPEQRVIEAERVMYAPIARVLVNAQNGALLEFIEQNTRRAEAPSPRPLPTSAEAESADRMMAATDTDLRTMLISEMLQADSAIQQQNVFSVIQF